MSDFAKWTLTGGLVLWMLFPPVALLIQGFLFEREGDVRYGRALEILGAVWILIIIVALAAGVYVVTSAGHC